MYSAEVVGCAYAKKDSYAKDIDCKWTNSTKMQEFSLIYKRVSTNFDPDIYAEENIFQLYQAHTGLFVGGAHNTTWSRTSVKNTENKFRNNFFWASKY